MALFSGWLTQAKPLPLNVMFVQLGPSFKTTSGSVVDSSTSWAGEREIDLPMGVILPPRSDNPDLHYRAQPPSATHWGGVVMRSALAGYSAQAGCLPGSVARPRRAASRLLQWDP